jgi:hypothetical protein
MHAYWGMEVPLHAANFHRNSNKYLNKYTVVRFDVLTALTIKNVFWDIKTQFVPHRRHTTFYYRALPVSYVSYVRFEVFYGCDYEQCRLLGCYEARLL